MIASRVVYPPNGQLNEPQLRTASPPMSSSPPTRIRTSGAFARRLSLTAASVANTVASSSLFGSSPPPSSPSSFYQQSSFFRSSSSTVNSNSPASAAVASSSAVNIPSTAHSPSSTSGGSAPSSTFSGRQRSRSTSHPPPPKYKTSRTPQLRISLHDTIGNLVLSAPVMAPGESIRGQIHLELPKATPVHSIEVCLTGTVTALDGTRLGSMKTITILEECKTVATASITNTRTNTTRRHTTPAQAVTTASSGSSVSGSLPEEVSTRGRRGRRGSVVSTVSTTTSQQDRARSPAIPIQNTIAAAAAAAAAATFAAQGGNPRRLSSELMSRTLSMPSPYHTNAANTSTLSLNRPVSPTPADLRGRRTSFSANVDVPVGGYGSVLGRGGANMSMVNISTINQLTMDDPNLPAAPSYDPPEYERIFSSPTSERSSSDSAATNAAAAGSTTGAEPPSAVTSRNNVPSPAISPSPVSSSEQVNASAQPAAEPVPEPAVEPKAVLMQPGNYVIPFSIRIPSNTTMSLPGSFSDPVGTISYQLQAVMRQILPSPDPYNPKALLVEPTFTSATQTIKLIPMNDPTYMPLYNIPFETEPVRANVGHWVWSTGFMESRAWVPKQGYRPGRMVPLVIHIVNHSDARQVVVETTLCKCLHYGSGLSKIRAMGIAGQGYLMDPTLAASPTTEGFEEDTSAVSEMTERPEERSRGRRRPGRRSSTNRHSRQHQQPTIPSPPASPYGPNFPSPPTNEAEDDSPEGSVHGTMASPTSMASISSQWESSIHSNNSSDSNSQNAPLNSSEIQYNPESRSSMTSPTPSSTATLTSPSSSSAVAATTNGSTLPVQQPLPIIQHQREKICKSRTLVNCSLAVDREIQKTIFVPIPHTAGYSILNAPLLEVSYEIVVKIRAEKVYSRGIRLSVPIVVVVPEEGDLEDDEDPLLVSAGLASPGLMDDLGLAFSGSEYDFGDQGECPPYEATTGSTRRRRRR
ncbi:Arrestin domain-containing protein 3 [Mortierella alpina]|nr:Arrestin domain-containing protein 3 [Mortierella alpina]